MDAAVACPRYGVMNVLGIETATPFGGVGLVSGVTQFERRLEVGDAFRSCVPAIDAVLAEAGIGVDDLDAITVTRGPGSFTGLRIGVTAAVTLAALHDVLLIAPSMLSLVAEACADPLGGRVCVSLDARRKRRYAAVVERVGPVWRVDKGPVDIEPSRVPEFAGDAVDVRLETRERSAPSLGIELAAWVARSIDQHERVDPAAVELEYVRPGV